MAIMPPTVGDRSPHVDHVQRELTARGHAVSIRPVPYRFQVGGDQAMVITG